MWGDNPMGYMYIFINEKEIWKDVTYPGVKPGQYRVSNYGDVYSSYANGIIKPSKKRKYYHVRLAHGDGSFITVLVHRLVAWEFVHNPNPEKFNFVNHKNGDTHYNYYQNLEWSNNQLNQIHAREHGLLNPRFGENHHNSTYSKGTIISIHKAICNGMSTSEIITLCKSRYECSDKSDTAIYALIHHIRKGDRWKKTIVEYYDE